VPFCGVSSDEKGVESEVGGKKGNYIKWQLKWFGLSVRLLGILKYILHITF